MVSTGLSDFHKMVLTVFKTTFRKNKPREIIYRDYSKFDSESFKKELKESLDEKKTGEYKVFEETFLQLLFLHAPTKKKVIRTNNMPYMTKTLRKAIMRRSALKNKFYKSKSFEDENAFRKQRNFCNRLYKREKRKYFNSLNLNDITDTKRFWKTVKPFLSDKGNFQKHITLIEDNKIFSGDKAVAEKLSNYFENAVNSLQIEENKLILTHVNDADDPIDVTKGYENHPSILAMKSKIMQPMQKFVFSLTNLPDIIIEVTSLNTKKAITFKNIPAKHLKRNI